MQDSARTETFSECRILRIVDILRLLLCVEVVKIAKELIEAVLGREKFIFVAKMIFSELSGRVTQRFKQFRDRRIFRAQADVGTRQANLGQSRSDRRLPSNERCASRSAALLSIPAAEHRAF